MEETQDGNALHVLFGPDIDKKFQNTDRRINAVGADYHRSLAEFVPLADFRNLEARVQSMVRESWSSARLKELFELSDEFFQRSSGYGGSVPVRHASPLNVIGIMVSVILPHLLCSS